MPHWRPVNEPLSSVHDPFQGKLQLRRAWPLCGACIAGAGLLNGLFFNDFSVCEYLLLDEVAEGGNPLGVAQVFWIGQINRDFY